MPVYRRHFGCDVRFCRNEDGVAFSLDDMAYPVADADGAMLREARAYIERAFCRNHPPFHAQVRGVVMQLLGKGACGNDEIARALNLHPRTLHRRLARESRGFQAIKDEIRRDFMLYYLTRTDLPLSRIAEKLGFSEQSAMCRFARTALGASPRELRRRDAPAGGLRRLAAAL